MRADSGTACTLVSSVLLQTFSAAPDEVINMNELVKNSLQTMKTSTAVFN